MVALVISGLLIAGVYQVVMSYSKTYQIQEQVVDMQQNVRFALQKMVTEIRMAGFGRVTMLLPLSAVDGPFQNIINPGNNVNNVNQNDDQVTILGAFDQISILAAAPSMGSNQILLAGNGTSFNPAGNNKYICVGGVESYTVTMVNGNTLTLNAPLTFAHRMGTPVFKVKAITYRLAWDAAVPTMPVLTREDKTDGGGPQVIAENIENLQFMYTMADGTETDSPGTATNIRMIRADVVAKTNMADPNYREGGGYRRRQITSNIQLRNMGFTQ